MTRPPKNPFRTKRIEEDDVLENAFVRFLYAVVVLSLLVGILMSLITLIGATMARALAERCLMDQLENPFLSRWCSEQQPLDGSMYINDGSWVRKRRPAYEQLSSLGVDTPPHFIDGGVLVPTTIATTGRLRLSLFKMTQSHGNHVVLALKNIWRLDMGGTYGHEFNKTSTTVDLVKQRFRRRRRTLH